jgi:hypothetical protein
MAIFNNWQFEVEFRKPDPDPDPRTESDFGLEDPGSIKRKFLSLLFCFLC